MTPVPAHLAQLGTVKHISHRSHLSDEWRHSSGMWTQRPPIKLAYAQSDLVVTAAVQQMSESTVQACAQSDLVVITAALQVIEGTVQA